MAGLYFGTYDMGDTFFGTRSDDVRRNDDVDLDSLGFVGLDVGDFVVSEVVIFGDGVALNPLLYADVVIELVGENKSSNWRLADINGSYLSESPLHMCDGNA